MIHLRKLSRDDGRDVYEMLKGIRSFENSYTNPTYEMSFSEFQKWLVQQELWDKGESLPNGFVPQTIFWLYDGITPVGMGKVRHALTDSSRQNGGNIGYAISNQYRGRGYGKELLRLLLIEAKDIGINEIILTIDKGNEASQRVCESNGGILFDENNVRWFYTFC